MVTILYALVASPEGIPLADVNVSSSTHGANARKVLAGIRGPIMERRCLAYNGYAYDMLPHKDGIVYMCVTEETCNRAVSFKFLESTRRRCSNRFGNPISLATELKKEVDFFNDTHGAKIREIRSEVAEVKDEMMKNVDKLMYRSDRLDNLLVKSTALEEESSTFRQETRDTKRQLLFRRIMIYSIITVVVIAIIFTLILMTCSKDGINFERCRGS